MEQVLSIAFYVIYTILKHLNKTLFTCSSCKLLLPPYLGAVMEVTKRYMWTINKGIIIVFWP